MLNRGGIIHGHALPRQNATRLTDRRSRGLSVLSSGTRCCSISGLAGKFDVQRLMSVRCAVSGRVEVLPLVVGGIDEQAVVVS